MGNDCLISTEFPFGMMKIFWKKIEGMSHNIVNVLKATKLFTSKWLILSICYVNFTSIFKIKNKTTHLESIKCNIRESLEPGT